MPDRNNPSLPFESSEPGEQQLWQALGELPQAEPSSRLRRDFYDQLEKAGSPGWGARLRGWLGLSGNLGWVTAAACLMIGFGAARLADEGHSPESARLAALEDNMAQLNRQLVLDRLQNDSAGTRLLGIHAAAPLAQDDHQIAQALLLRASEDPSSSVRSAAIEALASQMNSETVGDELMGLLETAESPIVQLALVDLVLRNGTQQQLDRLSRLAHDGRLHPDLVQHVLKSLRSETI